jgi:hypothetical protein
MRAALAAAVVVAVGVAVAVAARQGDSSTPPGGFSGVAGGQTAVVWAIGDGAAGTAAGRRLARAVAKDDPTRVLYLGDVYDRGTPAEFRTNMDGVYGSLVRRMLPTPGNHDWPLHREGYDPYWKRVTGKSTAHWYAVDIAGWKVLSLNSEGPHAAGSPQVRWLEDQLRGSSTCRLAFWHRPRFSAGRHGDQPDVQPLWSVVRGRAALVLNGHDHDLQRFRPVRGTVEIVSGAGGHEHYPVDESDGRLAFSDDTRDGAARITLRPGSATVDLVTTAGRLLDRTRVACRR